MTKLLRHVTRIPILIVLALLGLQVTASANDVED
jgi:hypothetical protein